MTLSRPVRARGLKRTAAAVAGAAGWSRPVRARGLKRAKEKAIEEERARRAPCGRVD